MPAPDELDRDKFYTSEEDDDGEYELEEPDPEVLAAEQRRRAEELAAHERSIDIDEIYRDEEHSHSAEILNEWARRLRPSGFRFQVKHLLIATAVVAIGLTLWRLELLRVALVLGVMFSIFGVYLYLQWKEKLHQDEVAARRHEMYARRRAAQHHSAALESTPATGHQSASPPLADETDLAWQKAMKEQEFRFQFSLAQLMLTMIAAAAVLGFVSILGPQNAATLLGLVALIGLVAHAAGFEPPPIVALGWWLLLLFYVLLSFVTVIWQAI